MSHVLDLFSPADGILRPLEQVPDPVFSERMLGDGLAVEPENGAVFSPAAGKVVNINKNFHALALAADGFEILLHVGVDTVSLKGKGFEMLVKEGDLVQQGQPLLRFDLQTLKKAVPCYWIICTVTAPEGVPVAKTPERAVKAGERVASAGTRDIPPQNNASPETAGMESQDVRIVNPNGIHARTAAVLARLAAQYDFPIYILKNGERSDAKSVVGIMSLALNHNDVIRLRAQTEDSSRANHALHKLTLALSEGLGETDTDAFPPAQDRPETAETLDFSQPVKINALSAGTGIARGTAWRFTVGDIPFEENAADPQTEQQLLENTLLLLEEDFRRETAAANAAARDILQAHVSLLKDPFLLSRAREIIAGGKTASFAFNEAIRAGIDLIKKTKNRFLMERIADFKDLRKRVLLKLSGRRETAPAFPPGCIVFAEDLLPSDLALFDANVNGVVLAQCSPTAHAAVMLRNMGVPALVCAGAAALAVPAGSETFADASEGALYVNPAPQDRTRLLARLEEAARLHQEHQKTGNEPALTQDGKRVLVGGNVSNEKEARAACQNGADALGLVRTEFLFLQNAAEPPTEDEQLQTYQNIVNAMHGRPVTLRTLDAGGDKPLSFVRLPQEPNPVLGVRGVRAYADNKNLFLAQVRAMLRVKPAGAARIMIPMVGFVQEAEECRRLIEQEKRALGVNAKVEIGMMVEVPSAALTARQFAGAADFFSLGTNDLTQYTLAIDRGHPSLAARADHLHPAVLTLIDAACRAGRDTRRPVAVCGAMAGDSQAVPLLVGLGVEELADSAAAVG